MQLLVEEAQTVGNDAAQVRVTPEELAQATAAIEARQNAIAQHEAATIPIGEAVHQLNLDATPEEVLAEVQAQRAKTQIQTGVKVRTRSRTGKIMAAVIVVQTAAVMLLGMRLVYQNHQLALSQQGAQRNALIYTLPPAVQQSGIVTPEARVTDAPLVTSGKFQTLDIPIGQTVQCKYNTLEKLAANTDPAHTYTALKPVGTTWEVARDANGFHVRCWSTVKDAEQLLNGQEAVVYATKTGAFGDNADTLVNIPIRAFQNLHVYATTDSPAGVVIEATHP